MIMREMRVYQKYYVTAVKTVVADLWMEDPQDICILCLTQPLHPNYEEACNPFFIFTIRNAENVREEIVTRAQEFASMDLRPSEVEQRIYYQFVSYQEFQTLLSSDIADNFLRTAKSAYRFREMEYENRYLIPWTQTEWTREQTFPTYADILQDIEQDS